MHLLEVLQPFLFHQKVPKILFSLSNKRKLQKFSAKLSIDNFKSIKFDVNINVKKNSNEDRFDYLQVFVNVCCFIWYFGVQSYCMYWISTLVAIAADGPCILRLFIDLYASKFPLILSRIPFGFLAQEELLECGNCKI
ncbi:uncharacterized protein [Nicotiana sylvestris]|uniref:Uncharacterized protein LOC104231745 isoform X1 n=1 Tax=Nicotiana sylvestris TaxID=4096 RepID=A0A1U7WT37_NICSY|nr:PREDICTED: uncharacterized protein LOC104231745 isoform X1 [Nicotiana sylvestris]